MLQNDLCILNENKLEVPVYDEVTELELLQII